MRFAIFMGRGGWYTGNFVTTRADRSDIKPENLLFERIPIIPSKNPVIRQDDEEKEDDGEFIPDVGGGGIGRVEIADFGLSKVIWNEETMTPCVTVGYTAPEIDKDERYSKSVDMWALRCVLYRKGLKCERVNPSVWFVDCERPPASFSHIDSFDPSHYT